MYCTSVYLTFVTIRFYVFCWLYFGSFAIYVCFIHRSLKYHNIKSIWLIYVNYCHRTGINSSIYFLNQVKNNFLLCNPHDHKGTWHVSSNVRYTSFILQFFTQHITNSKHFHFYKSIFTNCFNYQLFNGST